MSEDAVAKEENVFAELVAGYKGGEEMRWLDMRLW